MVETGGLRRQVGGKLAIALPKPTKNSPFILYFLSFIFYILLCFYIYLFYMQSFIEQNRKKICPILTFFKKKKKQ